MNNIFFLFVIGAAAASRLYVDAVGKLGRQAQQGTWGGCADIGNYNYYCLPHLFLSKEFMFFNYKRKSVQKDRE